MAVLFQVRDALSAVAEGLESVDSTGVERVEKDAYSAKHIVDMAPADYAGSRI